MTSEPRGVVRNKFAMASRELARQARAYAFLGQSENARNAARQSASYAFRAWPEDFIITVRGRAYATLDL